MICGTTEVCINQQSPTCLRSNPVQRTNPVQSYGTIQRYQNPACQSDDDDDNGFCKTPSSISYDRIVTGTTLTSHNFDRIITETSPTSHNFDRIINETAMLDETNLALGSCSVLPQKVTQSLVAPSLDRRESLLKVNNLSGEGATKNPSNTIRSVRISSPQRESIV